MGPARAHYYGRNTDNDEPTLFAAMAHLGHLSSALGDMYGEAELAGEVGLRDERCQDEVPGRQGRIVP
jgi:hypothetical protein